MKISVRVMVLLALGAGSALFFLGPAHGQPRPGGPRPPVRPFAPPVGPGGMRPPGVGGTNIGGPVGPEGTMGSRPAPRVTPGGGTPADAPEPPPASGGGG